MCAYIQYRSLKDVDVPRHTCFIDLSDKEEVGFGGTTGVKPYKLERLVGQIYAFRSGSPNKNAVRDTFEYGYSF